MTILITFFCQISGAISAVQSVKNIAEEGV